MTSDHHPRADLHIHSVYSDGTYSVREIVEKARTLELRAISITDHDTIDSIGEALELTKDSALEVIPGIEFSSKLGETSIHILAYFVNPGNADLVEYLELCEKRRQIRTEKMVKILQEEGFDITMDKVLSVAEGGVLGRPHIAEALLDVSEYRTVSQVFRDYLVKGKPGYVAKPTFNVSEIIELVHNSGGVCSLAHPKTIGDDSVIPKLVQRGLDAIEVVHSSHTLHDVEKYSALADQFDLVLSGGSDCHGTRLGQEVMGRFTISTEQVARLRSRSQYEDISNRNITLDYKE